MLTFVKDAMTKKYNMTVLVEAIANDLLDLVRVNTDGAIAIRRVGESGFFDQKCQQLIIRIAITGARDNKEIVKRCGRVGLGGWVEWCHSPICVSLSSQMFRG